MKLVYAMVSIGLAVMFLFDIVSMVREAFQKDAQRKAMARRRIAIHLGFYALLIGGFFAIVHFGPLRPVHEWIR